MIDAALLGLLHTLVFVYWLGGDLGAFYASRFLTAPSVSAERRLLAAKIVGDVDMAPRTALILTLPTGLALAVARGWLDINWIWPVLLTGASVVWLGLVWRLHLTHNAGATRLILVDQIIRWSVLAALITTVVSELLGLFALPLFLSLKLLLFATALGMGLLIRCVLKPLGPALAGLTSADSAAAEASLAATLSTARPLVMVIWACLISAAFLGLWTPI